MTTFRRTCEKGQLWLEKLKTKRFCELKYDKLKPRIFSKGAMTLSNENTSRRRRIHSIDVGEVQHLNFGAKTSELMVVHEVPLSKRRGSYCKREKVFVKSVENEVIVVPTFLLTYNPKFSKISNESYKSFSAIELDQVCNETADA